MNQAELIETAKTAIQGSEAETARRIEVTPQTLSIYKQGKKPMPDRIAVRLARLAGLDPASTLAEIEAEKADEETREVRREIARRAAKSVAALVMAVFLGLQTVSEEAKALSNQSFSEKPHKAVNLNVYYVKSRLARLAANFLKWIKSLWPILGLV